MCKPHKANGVKTRGDVHKGSSCDMNGTWRQEAEGHRKLVEGIDSLSRMAPWEREHGEGTSEPCYDYWCDCARADDPPVPEHRTEPLTATLAEMAA